MYGLETAMLAVIGGGIIVGVAIVVNVVVGFVRARYPQPGG